ncbi:MAG: Hsp70 family protein [Clostridiales bacterium]|nr:Hsp70 family protein [Clostridiales bacterium]
MKLALGFDIGDGESCVTLLTGTTSVAPRPIPLGGGNSFLSAVAVSDDGKIVIGENAVMDASAKQKHIRFKSRYREDRDGARAAMALFVKGIVIQLEAALGAAHLPALGSGSYVTVVGCPAAWDPETRTAYKKLLVGAGIAHPVLVSESRGALMYGIRSSDFGLTSQMLNESTLIVDLGSSTLDYAWITKDKETAVSGDARLGGGLFDEYMLLHSIQRSEDPAGLAALLERNPDAHAQLLLATRRLKEKYFLNEDAYAKDGCSEIAYLYAEGRKRVELSLNGQDMWQNLANKPMRELGNNSFISCLRNSLAQVGQLTAANPPRYLLLTGGASRMAFFRDECEQAFPKTKVFMSKEPELTISKGLAYCGFEDAAARSCAEELTAYVNGPAVETIVQAHLPGLYRMLADRLLPVIVNNVVRPNYNNWRFGTIDTIGQMESRIGADVEHEMQTLAVKRLLQDTSAQWLAPLLSQINAEISAVGQKHKLQLKGISSADLPASDVPGSGIAAPTIGTGFIQTTIALVAGIVVGVLCGGGGTALIMSGPVGWIIGFLLVAAAAVLGRKKAESIIKGLTIPKPARIVFTEGQLLNERNDSKMKESLIQKLRDETDMGEKLTDSISRKIDQAIRDLIATELPVQ